MKPIENAAEYTSMLDFIDKEFDKKRHVDSEEGKNLKAALLLIQKFENKHYQIPSPDPGLIE